MGFGDVLSIQGQGMNNSELTPEGSERKGQEGDDSLFALLFNSLFVQDQTKGQLSGEMFSIPSEPVNKNIENSDDISSEEYLQVIQNLFPTGKEANFGFFGNSGNQEVSDTLELNGLSKTENNYSDDFKGILGNLGSQKELLLKDILTKSNIGTFYENILKEMGKVNVFDDKMTSKGAFEKTGMVFSEAEGKSFPSQTELEKYIDINSQAKALAAQINRVYPKNPYSNEFKTDSVLGKVNVAKPDIAFEKPMITSVLDQKVDGNFQLAKNEVHKFGELINSGGNTSNSSVVSQNEKNINSGGNTSNSNAGIQSEKLVNSGENTSNSNIVSLNEKTIDGNILISKSGNEKGSSKEGTSESSNANIIGKINGDNFLGSRAEIPVKVADLGVNTAKIWDQVVNTLKQQSIRGTNELKELSIQLHPEELGKINVTMRMEQGQLHLVMNASEHATGSLLQNHIGELKDNLNESGLVFGSFSMENGDKGEQHSEREFMQYSRSTPEIIEEEEKVLNMKFSSVADDEIGRINISV